jgi:hypothetical protein
LAAIVTAMLGMTPDEIALVLTLDAAVVLLAVASAIGIWLQR